MESQEPVSRYAHGGIVQREHGVLVGTIGCTCGCFGWLTPPVTPQPPTAEPYDERESNP